MWQTIKIYLVITVGSVVFFMILLVNRLVSKFRKTG